MSEHRQSLAEDRIFGRAKIILRENSPENRETGVVLRHESFQNVTCSLENGSCSIESHDALNTHVLRLHQSPQNYEDVFYCFEM